MVLVLAFGIVLLVSASIPGLAARTIMSTALLFLVTGAVVGHGGFGLVDIPSDGAFVRTVADLALFTVLFTDGRRADLPALRATWRLSGRALGLGMPLTMLGVALPAHFLVGLDWPTAFLVGAVLAPTDPVFAAAMVGRDDVLLRLLNVESGVNDGLALRSCWCFSPWHNTVMHTSARSRSNSSSASHSASACPRRVFGMALAFPAR